MHASSAWRRVRSRRLRRTLVVALTMTLVASSCSDDSQQSFVGDEASESLGSAAPAEPVQGGQATYLAQLELRSLDPATFTGNNVTEGPRAFALYGALIVQDPETLEMDPVLAESFEPMALDGLHWRLVLRPGLVFSDGSPFTAADVQANWERLKDPDVRSGAFGTAAQIASANVVDELTLDVALTAPNAHFDKAVMINAMNYIASGDAITSDVDLGSHPVGAGPFVLESWERDSQLELTRNPNWYDSPRPYLDKLTFRVIADENQRADTFATGDADFYFTGAPLATDELSERGATAASAVTSTGSAFIFNTRRAPFDDVRVRRAVWLGVDWDALLEAVFGVPVSAPTAYEPESSVWYSPDADLPAYDADEARRLFEEVERETGSPVSFTLRSGPGSVGRQSVEFVQTSLMQLGVEVNVEVADASNVVTPVLEGDYQMHVWVLPHTDPEPQIYNITRGGLSSNYTGYRNAEVDAALDLAHVTQDVETRKTAYATVYRHLAEDLPWIPVNHTVFSTVVREGFGGVKVYYDAMLRPDLVYLTEDG